MLLKEIVLNLIPDTLRNEKLFIDTLSVFIEYLEENSPETLDNLNIYEESSPGYAEIVNAYAKSFMDILEKAKNNLTLQNKLIELHSKFGITYDVTKLNINPNKILSKDNLELLKNFYQTKGTLGSFRYVFDIFNKLQLEESALQSETTFDVSESPEILTYDLKTNMMQEIYEQFVKPMVHPLGWSYVYSRLLKTTFKDYMFVDTIYNIINFKVDNTRDNSITDDYKRNTGHLFETDENGDARLLNNLPITYPANGNKVFQVFRYGKYFNELDIESEISLVQDSQVVNIETGSNEQTEDTWIKITFASGEYLEQHSVNPESGKRTLILYYGDGPNYFNKTIKKDYSPYIGEYGLDIQYTTELKSKTLDKMTLEMARGMFDTVGNLLFCGCGNGLVSDFNICGSNRISNIADSNILTRVKNLTLDPRFKETRQTFLGFKYKYPSMYLYINLENYKPEEFPLTVSCEDSNFTIESKDSNKKIIEVQGIKINTKFTLDYGYTDKEFITQIFSGDMLIEECKFRLIPNIPATQKAVNQNDFEFYFEEPDNYSREAVMQYFTDFEPPEHIDSNADTYELSWDYIEYLYYANIGSLAQIPPSTYIKETDVFNYLYPKYYSNIVGHFKLFDFDLQYRQDKGRIVLKYPHGAICNDSFTIETKKA